LEEANKNKYFIDGFLIKHCDIYPSNFNKEDLFYEQKVFLVYLLGLTPSMEEWSFNMDFINKKDKIDRIESIELSKEDLDMAKLHGKDIKKLKEERLKNHKKQLIKDLNDKFGIKNDEEKRNNVKINNTKKDKKEDLWDILAGKNLIGNKNNG